MPLQVKQKLFISIVILAVLWQLISGFYVIESNEALRSSALNDCIGRSFNLFEYCYKHVKEANSLSVINFLTPFIPLSFICWLSWLFKPQLDIEIKEELTKLRKIFVILVNLFACICLIIPIFVVIEKSSERLTQIVIIDLFLTPWLALCWLTIPICIKFLIDSEKKVIEYKNEKKLIYAVIASPFVAIIMIIVRELLKF